MSGFDAFDLVATPIHEFDVPSIGSVLTPVAPRRSSGSWARPSDAEDSQERQIARRLLARGASSLVPQPLMEEASRAWSMTSMSLVPAWQCSIESVREGPTAEVLSQPQALRPPPSSPLPTRRTPPLPTPRTPLFRRGSREVEPLSRGGFADFADAFHGPPPDWGASRRRAITLWWSSFGPRRDRPLMGGRSRLPR